MSNTATINRGGDLLSLTAQRGGTVLVSLHSVNPAGHLTGLSVPGAQLRAALDEVAPAGSYTRTDEDWKARAEKAERERDEWKDSAVKAMADLERAEQPRPLTADGITDEARDRAYRAVAALSVSDWDGMSGVAKGRAMALVEAVITEITRPEPPARPVGAEDWEDWLIHTLDHGALTYQQIEDLANRVAQRVTEEQP